MPTKLEDIRRASKVVNECARQGLGYFVEMYGLKWQLPLIKRLRLCKPKEPELLPQRIRKVMENLGGAYIKLGQVLSLRPDLIPNEYCEEFKHLRDETMPVMFSEIKKIIEEELKQPLTKVFAKIDKYPLGTASVAQVHKAKFSDGKTVAVKIQKKGVEQKFKEDIDILYYLAHKIEKHSQLKKFKPLAIVEEFERYTSKELDFLNEAKNIDKFYQHFRDSDTIQIPKIHWQYATPKIIVMDYLKGTKLSEAKTLSTNDRKTIVCRLADASLKQFFETKTFHADLHPGNIIVLPHNKIGLLDFGIVGTLSEETTKKVMLMYVAVIQQNVEEASKRLLEIAPPSPETNVDQLKEDIENILTEWCGKTQKVRYTQMLYLIFQKGIDHKLRFPRDLILFSKSAMTAEGTCLEIYPQFDFVEYSKPKIAELMRKQHTPQKIIKDFLQKTYSVAENIAALPEATVSLMHRLEREPIKVGIENTDVRHLGFDINTSSNRLSYSMLIAALIIAGSLLINTGPLYQEYSLISIAAFLIAGVLLVPLLVSVLHEGNKKYDSHSN